MTTLIEWKSCVCGFASGTDEEYRMHYATGEHAMNMNELDDVAWLRDNGVEAILMNDGTLVPLDGSEPVENVVVLRCYPNGAGPWLPWCDNVACQCMQPNINGACDEYMDAESWRCGRCGWPPGKHNINTPSEER